MAKKVIVKSGTVFNTLNAARAYYNALRQATEIGGKLSETDRSDLLDIYHHIAKSPLGEWRGERRD
ncbi:hypothetical protein ACWA6H_03900 [Pseudomonas bijieensis]